MSAPAMNENLPQSGTVFELAATAASLPDELINREIVNFERSCDETSERIAKKFGVDPNMVANLLHSRIAALRDAIVDAKAARQQVISE